MLGFGLYKLEGKMCFPYLGRKYESLKPNMELNQLDYVCAVKIFLCAAKILFVQQHFLLVLLLS